MVREYDDFTYDAEQYDQLIAGEQMAVMQAIAAKLGLTAAIKAAMAIMGRTGAFDEGYDSGYEIGDLTTAVHLPLTVDVATFTNQLMNPMMANALQLALNVNIQTILRIIPRCNAFMVARGIISFGDFILNQRPFHVDLIGVYSAANKEVARSRLLRAGSVKISSQYQEKIIAIRGRIVAENRSKLAMENALDRLHLALSKVDQELKIGYQDERFYDNVELIEELEVEWDEYTREFATFNAKFLARDPFSYSIVQDSNVDTASLSTVSGNVRSKNILIDVGGTIFTRPVITVTFPSGGGSPYGTTLLTVTNTTVQPNQVMQISYVFNAGDIVEIDSENETVEVNGVITDFQGQFILLDPRAGDNNIEIRTTSTSLPTSLPVTIAHRDRYLS